jgi:hypothetical protein
MSRGKQTRSSFEIRELEPESELPKVIEEYNEMVKYLNFLTKQLSLQSNFDGQVISVEIPATTNLRISHRLGVVPKYRIILRQEGNGLLTDIPLEWSDKFITIRNNGAVVVKATIILLKE